PRVRLRDGLHRAVRPRADPARARRRGRDAGRLRAAPALHRAPGPDAAAAPRPLSVLRGPGQGRALRELPPRGRRPLRALRRGAEGRRAALRVVRRRLSKLSHAAHIEGNMLRNVATDHQVVGKVGRLTSAIEAGGQGEVTIPIRGGTETYF